VAMLGILKAGGAYVPLDPLLPMERIAFMLGDAQASLLITQARLVEKISELCGTERNNPAVEAATGEGLANLVVLRLRTGASLPGTREGGAGGERPTAQNLAYLIYTSGSTGRPKGVQIIHQALVNFLESMRSTPGISASDTMFAVTTLSFDIAGLELLLPLVVGGRVVIAPREVATDGRRLAKELERSAATIMQATPTTWRLLLAAGWAGDRRLKILCGGEAWTAELARALLARCGSLWNMYGPTETTIWSSVQRIEAGAEVLLGGPIANTQFHVLDRWRQMVPIGVAGELYIGGYGLARGYWRRPEMTEEKFVTGGFTGAGGARFYRTGDLVRFRSDGRIEFLRRVDDQVKIRGYRIETSEVEALLAQHPAVRECVVVAQPDVSGENRLVAYFVGQEGKLNTPQELRRFMAGKLPYYMMPALVVPLSELPRTPNGKINRRELPVPELVPLDAVPSPTAATTPTEATLVEIWREILGRAEIGLNENFFELGGHSLMVTQAIARIRNAFDIELPMHSFFAAPTIAAAAVIIEKKLISTPESNLPPAGPVLAQKLALPAGRRNRGGQT
jgi:amino acid adenylation domain-containing protein